MLALDAVMIRRGIGSLSERAGRHRPITLLLLVALGCHLCSWPRWAARFDPLRHAARLIAREGP